MGISNTFYDVPWDASILPPLAISLYHANWTLVLKCGSHTFCNGFIFDLFAPGFFCYIPCVHFCIPCKHNIIIWNRKWCCSKTHRNIISYEAYHCNWYERIYLMKHIIVPEIKCLWSQCTSPMKMILSDATTFSIGWMYDILSLS